MQKNRIVYGETEKNEIDIFIHKKKLFHEQMIVISHQRTEYIRAIGVCNERGSSVFMMVFGPYVLTVSFTNTTHA
jgi:hypothetical protein